MNKKPHHLKYSQKGFTLIELIVALALGLLITAAATQLFLGGVVSTRIQQANAELQDSGVFGLEYVARDVRLANYGNISNPELTNTTPMGGIVFSQGGANSNVSEDIGETSVTRQGLGSNASENSDQLTIQFIAPNRMFNCEGEEVMAGEYVIQRYFLRKDNNGAATDLALACDANKHGVTSAAGIANFGGNNAGQVIMPRVDHLRFYLGTMTKDSTHTNITYAYYSINDYIAAVNAARSNGEPLPRVVSVKAVAVVRSMDNTNNELIDETKPVQGLDSAVTLTAANQTKHLRRTYITTIAIRNGMGDAL